MLSGYHRRASGELMPIADGEAVRQALADAQGLLWLDLEAPSEEAHVLADVFGFHPLTIEDCLSPRIDPAKIDDHGEYLFVVVQGIESAVSRTTGY